MRRFVAALLFLMFVDDAKAFYAGYMWAPFEWVHTLLYLPLIKVRPFDILMAGALIVVTARRGSRGPRVAPMRNALLLSVGTVIAWFAYGVARGGSAWAASWQVYLILSAALVTFTIASAFHTVEHFTLLGKALVAAAIYRAAMCWFFYLTEVRPLHIMPFPEYLTSHDDTVLWVVALLILVLSALQARSLKVTARASMMSLFILGAITWNTRRLAWASLVLGLATMFVLLPPGPLRRKRRRLAILAVPLLALYVAVGLGRTERVFRPLRALSSISTDEDASTKARNVENLGLIATAHGDWLGGTGWGHKYIELTDKYSIAASFELWPYIPHNSILGLLAYTGMLGFAGFWLPFPTAVFLNARIARFGNGSVRAVGVIGASQMVVCAAQLYGDMGLFSVRTLYVLAGSYALALRLPIAAGVWRAPGSKEAPQPPRIVSGGDSSWPS